MRTARGSEPCSKQALYTYLSQCRIENTMEMLRVTSAGQLSLPARIRRRWGTRRVAIEDLGDSVVLRPIPDDPIGAARGALKGRIPSSETIRARARADERQASERRAQQR